MTKVILLDAGHGENTYNDTGSKGVPGLEEHHFNATVVKYTIKHLERNGFKVLLSQPLFDKDVPLINRTNFANNNNVDLLMSFHADASGNKDARGHWAFYWHTSINGKKFADIWSDELTKATNTRHRGNQASIPGSWTNFHMVRESKATSVLMEHAFMTNPEDLKLLQSDEFRKQCAEAAAKAVCRYFGVVYKAEVTKPMEPIEVQWAKENGISDGTNLDQPPTRFQLIVMLYRFYQFLKRGV